MGKNWITPGSMVAVEERVQVRPEYVEEAGASEIVTVIEIPLAGKLLRDRGLAWFSDVVDGRPAVRLQDLSDIPDDIVQLVEGQV